MLIYLLLVSILLSMYVTYKVMDEDITSPAFILVTGYALSIICAVANVDNWGINLHWQTIGVLSYGIGSFIIIGYFVKEKTKKLNDFIIAEIEYNEVMIKYFCLFQTLTIFLWGCMIFFITSLLGDYSNFAERMVAFRNWNSYSIAWTDNLIYFVVNQASQISSVSAYLFTYIIINDWIAKCHIVKHKWLVLSIGLTVLQGLLTGGRLGIVNLVFAALVMAALYLRKYTKTVIKLSPSVLVKATIVLILGLFVFYLAKVIVGRGSGVSLSEFIPYITMYIGGPIQLLDMFLINPLEPSNIIGKETFYGIIFPLSRFGLIDVDPYIIHLEFRNAITGAFLGNIYTSFRSYIYDFGYSGLLILPIVFSYAIHYLYYQVLYVRNAKNIDFLVLVFLLAIPTVLFDFVRSFFFTVFLSTTTLKQIVILAVLAKLMVKDFKMPFLNR